MGKLGKRRSVAENANYLTKKGYWCVESLFNSVLYAVKDDDLIILSGTDGIAVKVDNILKFCNELTELFEIIQYRKERGN